MRKSITLYEFAKLCKQRGFSDFVFADSNQEWWGNEYPHTYTTLLFKTCIVHTTVGLKGITFKNGFQVLQFSDVKDVQIINDDKDFSLVFAVLCGKNNKSNDVIEYVFVAN